MPKVKRPTSAWIYYTNENRKAFQEKHKDLKMTDLTKKMGEAWAKLTAGDKKKFEEMAAKDKERYTKEKEAAGSDSDSDSDNKGKRKGKRGADKKKKDKDAPKRAASAWILYLNDHRDATRKKYPDEKITETTKRVSEMWGKATESEKAKYNKQAEVLKEQYKKDKDAYDAKKKAEASSSDPESSDEEPKKKKAKKGSGKKKAASDSD